MRPIKKVPAPQVYTDYQDAQKDLIACIDRYCSYCERHQASSIHVEHKMCRRFFPQLLLSWDNFLLACGNCNASKLDKRAGAGNYLWPDRDNTFRAFRYLPDGRVRVNRMLPKRLRRSAARTLFLMGLDKVPGGYREPTDKDYRVQDRREEFRVASTMLEGLLEHDTARQRNRIVAYATSKRMFSIWMQVFKDYPDIVTQLILRFLGTAQNAFDVTGRPVHRPGGLL
jgi:uncharacterized protein (TIGR02646 family)